MPYPAHALQNFEDKYGKKGRGYFFGWMHNHPHTFAKALHTAQSEGGSHVAPHSAGKSKGSHIIERVRTRRHKRSH